MRRFVFLVCLILIIGCKSYFVESRKLGDPVVLNTTNVKQQKGTQLENNTQNSGKEEYRSHFIELFKQQDTKDKGKGTMSSSNFRRQLNGSSGIGQTYVMILVSELGDETFILAAIMAMRYSKWIVFAGAGTALAAMTVISTALGVIVPNLISQELVQYFAGLLYTLFGLRLFWAAYNAENKDNNEDIKQVDSKLQSSDNQRKNGKTASKLKIFLEACVLTFIAEWGIEAKLLRLLQPVKIVLSGVAIGGILGHFCCTGLAVIGGELIAKKISQRTVAICGGILFFTFAINSFISQLF